MQFQNDETNLKVSSGNMVYYDTVNLTKQEMHLYKEINVFSSEEYFHSEKTHSRFKIKKL